MSNSDASKEDKDFAQSAHPLNWYEVAKVIHDNAESLYLQPSGETTRTTVDRYRFTTPTSNRSVFLLSAFAMENILKAYAIYENPSLVRDGKLSYKLKNGHSLRKIQALCRKSPSPKRTSTLIAVLEEGTNSWARYPCATKAEFQKFERIFTPEFWRRYETIFDLHCDRLEALLAKWWTDAYGDQTRVEFYGDRRGTTSSILRTRLSDGPR